MLVGQSDKQNNRSPRYLPWRKKSVEEDPLSLTNSIHNSPDNFWVLFPAFSNNISLRSLR